MFSLPRILVNIQLKGYPKATHRQLWDNLDPLRAGKPGQPSFRMLDEILGELVVAPCPPGCMLRV